MKVLNLRYTIAILTILLFTFFTFTVKAQIIKTVAGNGFPSYSGDGGAATSASLNGPIDVTVDAVGNLYIVDGFNNVIRKVNTSGIISTVAGNVNSPGYIGDGGAATSANLNNPSGVAVDTAGNIYIADALNNRIRKVNTNGIISTVAGNGKQGYSGDGGAATSASLSLPSGLAVDAVGNIYIAEGQRIRKVNTSGVISTVAGNGTDGYSGDGGAATSASLNDPTGVSVDAAGNIYIADQLNSRIRKVNTNGVISTVVGNGIQGYSGDGGAATSASLNNSIAVTVDAVGNIYIADEGNNRIRKVNTSGVISTVAGNGTNGYSGNGGVSTNAELNNPFGIAVDGTGNMYIADNGNQRIRKVSVGAVPITLASFTAIANNKTIITTWHTSTELNTSYFIIQHSTDGSSFTDIGTVKAIGNGANGYQFTDNSPTNGINYYRLKSVDKDGAFTYSKVVSVQFTVNSNQLTVFPNPSKSSITISGNHIVSIQVVDNMGKIIKTQALKDATNPTLSISGLSAGIYHLCVQTTDGKVSVAELVKE